MSGDKGASGNTDILKQRVTATVDCAGQYCPHPIMEVAKKMRQLQSGQVVELIATDPGAKGVVPDWCQKTGNPLLAMEEKDKVIRFYIEKGK